MVHFQDDQRLADRQGGRGACEHVQLAALHVQLEDIDAGHGLPEGALIEALHLHLLRHMARGDGEGRRQETAGTIGRGIDQRRGSSLASERDIMKRHVGTGRDIGGEELERRGRRLKGMHVLGQGTEQEDRRANIGAHVAAHMRGLHERRTQGYEVRLEGVGHLGQVVIIAVQRVDVWANLDGTGKRVDRDLQ